MNKKNAILLTIAMIIIYLFGALSGYLIAINIMKIHRDSSRFDSVSIGGNNGILNLLIQRLNLNASQSNEVKSILKYFSTEKTSYLNNFDAGMEKIQEKAHQDIKNILNEEQIEKFNIFVLKYDILADTKPDRIRKGIRRQGMRLKQN